MLYQKILNDITVLHDLRLNWMNSMMIFENNYHRQILVFVQINGMFDDLFNYSSEHVFFVLSSSYLESGQIDMAEKEKSRIEDAQRSRSGTAFSPKWFRFDGDSFVFIRDEDSSDSYWKKREEHWSGVEFIQLW